MSWPLALSHDCLFSLTGTKILKKAQAALPKEAQNLSSAALEAPDLNAVSLGKEHMFTAAKSIVWDELGHPGNGHIHIHMLVSARVWRDKQIAMPGALRSRSFWLQDCSWAQLLRASRTHYNQKVSWLTPPPGE